MAERRRNEEEEEVRRQRAEAIHKPQPIKKYAPVELQSSSKPLTVPVSPKFSKLSSQK